MSSPSYLGRKEIDDQKWDLCIKGASNGLIYATTFFLDNMANDWDALILDDYKAVMPLVCRKKFGINYLYQPYFMAQLGIFGRNISNDILKLFLQNIPRKFAYIDIDLNEENKLDWETLKGIKIRMKFHSRTNYVLNPVNPGKRNEGYHRLAGRMLHKAAEANVIIRNVTDPQKLITFYQRHYTRRHAKINATTYSHLSRTSKIALDAGLCNLYVAEIGGDLVAVYLVLRDERYYYSVLGGSSQRGRDSGAFYALTDAAIRDAGESGKIFRFEGSDVPGIASFNSQFGAVKQSYLHLKYNNLPIFIRWMK